MKRKAIILSLLAAVSVLLAPAAVSGQPQTGKFACLVVETQQGSRELYRFSDSPELSFDGGDVVLSSSGGSVRYGSADIKHIYFGGDEYLTGIDATESEFDLIVKRLGGDKLFVGGRDAHTLRVAGLSGVTFVSEADIPDEGITVDLSRLVNGVYLIVINDTKTLKILKQ